MDRQSLLRALLPARVEPAWVEQVHSATVHSAQAGANPRGDALFTDRAGLALSVVTADCVPVLFAAQRVIAAAHAGWRGLAQQILPATVRELEVANHAMTAWIGPSIGPCCYEVSPEVAEQVATVSSPEVIRDGPRGRPHLDLYAAARAQLRHSGVTTIHQVDVCTRCDETRLWSYRRDGGGAGRNLAAIWRCPEVG